MSVPRPSDGAVSLSKDLAKDPKWIELIEYRRACIYHSWCNADDPVERERLHSEHKALSNLANVATRIGNKT